MVVDSSRGKDEAPAVTTSYILHFKQNSQAKANMTPPPQLLCHMWVELAFRILSKKTQSDKVWMRTRANRANQNVCGLVVHSEFKEDAS